MSQNIPVGGLNSEKLLLLLDPECIESGNKWQLCQYTSIVAHAQLEKMM